MRGTATLPALAAGSGAAVDNEGTVTFLAQPNVNGSRVVTAGATIVVESGLALPAGVTATNDGTIQVNGSVNFDGTLTTNGALIVDGVFVLGGTVTTRPT